MSERAWKAGTDRVLIEKSEKQTKTASGLHLPDSTKSSVGTGTVIAAGPKAKNILPGDFVFYETKFSIALTDKIVSVESPSVLGGQRSE